MTNPIYCLKVSCHIADGKAKSQVELYGEFSHMNQFNQINSATVLLCFGLVLVQCLVQLHIQLYKNINPEC